MKMGPTGSGLGGRVIGVTRFKLIFPPFIFRKHRDALTVTLEYSNC